MPRATIPPLDWRAPIVDPKTGNPTPQFQRVWQQLFGNDAGTYDTISDTATGLDSKVPQTRLINTTAPLNGGGDLTNDLSLTHNTSGVTAAVYGDATHIPQLTVNATGHITAASNLAFSAGTVTSVSVVTANGVSGSVANPTTTPAITLTLGAITPSSVAASGTVTGSNLSGTNTGDQTSVSGNAGSATILATGRTLAITGDLTWTSPSFNGSGNVTAAGTLAASGVTAATYGDATHVPQIVVDAKGRITSASNVVISGGGGGASAFTGLSDCPASYAGAAGQAVFVNGGATGLVFGSPSSGLVSVVQYKSFIGSPPTLTMAATPTLGNQLVLMGTHFNGVSAVATPWSTIKNTGGAVDDGIIAVAKIVTPADTGSATITNPLTQSSGGGGGSNWTIVEVSGALPIVSMCFDSFQEVVGTSSSLKVASGKNGSLIFGIAATTSANTAPSSIAGTTVLTTVTGTSTGASPRQITPFQITNVNAGTGATITPTYAASCKMYGFVYVFSPA